MRDLPPSAAVLGKLLVALQALDILPDANRMAAFLRPTLADVPGVADAFVCLEGRVMPADAAAGTTLGPSCPGATDPSAPISSCRLTEPPGVHRIAVRTPRRTFGCLLLVVDDEAQFGRYQPFLLNIGHMIATILENRENARSLAEANTALNQLVDELEDRVAGRTRDLEAAEERYRTTLATLPDAISTLRAVRDDAGRIVDFEWTYASPARAVQDVGTELVGARLLDVHPEYREVGLFDAFCAVVATGEQIVREVRLTTADQQVTIVECRASRSGDCVVASMRDVTARHAAARLLAQSEARYRLLAENASDVVMLLTPDRDHEWVSDSVTEVLGWAPQHLVGRPIDEYIHPDDLARFRQLVEGALDGAVSIELRFRRPDDRFQSVACRIRAKVDEAGTVVSLVGALVDITDRKAAEEELAYAASHDPLTGLANRTMLVDEADRALAAGRRSGRAAALLMVDLDHFKNINDALGHSVGDDLLRAVGRRILESVRPVDLVARLGGDEFVVLLRDLDDPTVALRLAELLVVESRDPVTVGGSELYATASVGLTLAVPGVDPVRGAADLIREADTAMYAAKLGGRDRVAQFTDDLRRAVDDRMHLESDLRRALGRDELAVWYQPEIDLHDGTVRSAEALLRWHHPDGRLRMASEFIDVAEDSGLILGIGAWALARACADAASWASDDGTRPPVLRFNLSPPELGQLRLLSTVDDALAASGLDPRLLCVEITETTMLSDSSTVRANLHGIRSRGIELAIDDFGTGYGSLTYLRRYPIDVLKIDRSFVTHIATDAGDRDLVAGVVAIADRLGMSVTAEGVETGGQAQILRSIGCAGGQGFLYSPALPVEELTRFVRGRRPAGRSDVPGALAHGTEVHGARADRPCV